MNTIKILMIISRTMKNENLQTDRLIYFLLNKA